MRKIAFIMVLLFAGLSLSACTRVPAGHVGVKVYLLGGAKGVDNEILTPGRYWIGINEELYLFPTFTQNYVWTRDATEGSEVDESISFQTIEGMVVNADVGISYQIDPERVPLIFQKYRRGVAEITDTFIRNMVRDALVTEVATRPVDDVYGPGKAEIMAAVEERVRNQVREIGIVVERIYWVGEMRLPNSVTDALNEKIRATQRAAQRRNEIEEKKAEAQKLIEEARGEAESLKLRVTAEAEANERLSKSLTPQLLRYTAIQKWSGELPKSTGGETLPFLNINE